MSGSPPAGAWALLVSLLTLVPAPAIARETLRVAVISDLNGSYGSTRYEASVDAAVARILALEPDLVISTGDMVAGQRIPHLARGEVERMWRSFHAKVSDPLAAAGIPLAVTPGNHDGSAYSGFERERRIYAEQWRARRPSLHFLDDSHYPFRYAFEAGGLLFISLDATTVGPLPGRQMDWLEDLLERYGRTHASRVVFSHVPLWPVALGREREYIGDARLDDLLQRAGVDLYLSGHHHAFYPGYKDAVLHVAQSCLGADPRRLIGGAKRSPRSFTLLEIGTEDLRVTAFQGADFATPVDWSTLPERIRSAVAELIRADLALAP